MKYVKYAALLPMILTINVAQAAGEMIYNAPFQDVEVKGASKIYVNYNFDASKEVLVCTSPQAYEVITSVEWSYKDVTRKLELPIMLNDNAQFKGYLADPQGQLVITNEFAQGSDKNSSILVSCEYKEGFK